MSSTTTRDTRLLIGAVGLSALGDLTLGIPLALEVSARAGGSALAVAAFFVCLFAPMVVLAAPAGRLVDRAESRGLLLRVSLLQAAATLALLVAPGVGGLLVLTACIGAGFAIAAPAEFALLPIAAGEDRVARANGHVETARYAGMTAGPLIGGVLAGAGRFHAAVVINAASFLVVAGAAALLHVRRVPGPRAAGDRGRARDGIAPLLRDPAVATVLATAIAALAFFSISMTAELFFIVDTLGAGRSGYGLVLATWTGGMVLGATFLARRVPAHALAAVALVAVGVQGLGLLTTGLAQGIAVAVAGMGLGGVAHGVKNVLLRTLIHDRVPNAARGRAFAAYNAARNAAELGAIAAGGVLVGAVGARTAMALSGAVPLVLALGAGARLTLRGVAATTHTTPIRRSIDAHVQG